MKHCSVLAWRVGRSLGVSACVAAFALLGCETTGDVKEPVAPPTEAVRGPEADPHALCEMRAAVDDALHSGRTATLASSVDARLAANPDDMLGTYAKTALIKKEKERWTAFRAIRETRPDSTIADLGECEVYAGWKMGDQAEPPCARAEAGNLGAIVDVARGNLALQLGDAVTAIAAQDRALAKDPGCVPAFIGKARALDASGDTAGALASWDSALAAFPQCFSCIEAKAMLVEKNEGLEASLPHWERALQIIPDHADVLKRYAAAQVGRDDAKALAAYEGALAAGAKDSATMLAAASLADKLGQADKAMAHVEKVVADKPDELAGWRLMWRLAKAKGDVAAAERAAREVARLLPDDGDAHLEIARLAARRDAFADALDHFDAAVGAFGSAGADAAASLKAATDERKALWKTLNILGEPTGTAQKVVATVQSRATKVYEERLKKNRRLKGSVQIDVRTGKDGSVESVEITGDELKDAYVAGCLVGNLRRATIKGGSQKLSFELSFEK